MFSFRKKVGNALSWRGASRAAPSRSRRRDATSSTGAISPRLILKAPSRCSSAWAVFGAPRRRSGTSRASGSPPSAIPAAPPPIRPMRKCARVAPGKTRSFSSSTIPKKLPFDELLRVFWEGHDPTQGMRQGNDVGTQYRSAIYATTPEQIAAVEASRNAYEKRARGGRATARSRRKSRRPAPSTSPRTITSNISPRTRMAIADMAAPASPARSEPASCPDRSRIWSGFQAGKTAPEMPSKAPGTSSSHKSLSGSTGPGSSSRPFGTLEKPERR